MLGFLRGKKEASVEEWSLQMPLLTLTRDSRGGPLDSLTLEDALTGVHVMGGIGSGKTSGSGAALARAYLSHNFGGLVLCAKREERELWERYAAETGRSASLLVVSPEADWCLNFLDYELRHGGRGAGQVENLVNLFSVVVELAAGPGMREGERFWEASKDALIRAAVGLIELAGEALTLDTICRVIASAPQDIEMLDEPQWQRTSLCARLMDKAQQRDLDPRQVEDAEIIFRYWRAEFPRIDERTRSGIIATFASVANKLQYGDIRRLLCERTTFTPELAYTAGRIIVIDMSVQEYGEAGRLTQGIIKYCFQRAMLRRSVRQHPRPVFLVADEAQNFVSSYDYRFLAECRGSRCAVIYLTQNVSNYRAVLSKDAQADALLGLFQVKIFHANADFHSNKLASETIGEQWAFQYNYGGSHPSGGGQGTLNAGGQQHRQFKVPPEHFTALRRGGAANGFEVDAYLFRAGPPWRLTGDTWLALTFRQR